jgi:hypothetical protein
MRASRDGVSLIALGCAPFAAGAIVPADGDIGLACPFRTITGLPCPFCGATRAFALAARGDAGFLEYNAVWVAVAALCVLLGAAALLIGRSPLAVMARRPVGVLVALTALGWAYALAQRATIASA